MSQTKAQLIDNLVQPITGALGSASAPTFSFTTDPNTGLYSPGADQVAISTNGSGRLFVDSSGRIGAGVASPGYPLDLVSQSGESIRIRGTSGTDIGKLLFTSNNAGADYGWLSSASSYLAFGTASSERMRLTATGLGIGTSSPSYIFETSQGGTAGVVVGASLAASGNGGSGRGTGLLFKAPGSSSAVEVARIDGRQNTASATANNATLNFMVADSGGTLQERVTIDNSGRVGIGTTTPTDTNSYGTAVDIRGSSTGNGGVIYLRNSDATVTGQLAVYGDGRMDLGTTTNHPLRFFTFNSERARIDSSGKLLVGTSSARSWAGVNSNLQVEGTTWDNSSASFTRNSADSVGGALALGKSRGTALGSHTVVQSGDFLGRIHFVGADGSALIQGASITGEVDGTPGSNDMPGRLVFSTTADGASSPTERMRLDNKGSLSLWNPSNTTAGPQDVDGRIFAYSDGSNSNLYVDSRRSDAFVHINQSFGDTANRGAVAFYRNESQIGSISISSAQVFYNTTSDHRLKENVVDLEGATELVKQLQPRQFNFISEPDKVVRGFIAHEVQAIAPEAVTGEKDAEDENGNPKYQGIDQSKLVPLLTAALQEAVARIEQLEAAVATLQGQ